MYNHATYNIVKPVGQAQGPTRYIGSRALIKENDMQTAYETQAPV